MSDDFIDYGQLIDDAMHIIVKKALEYIKKEGLPGKHHFFISFLTSYPGVELSEHLRKKYPDEMTIVLQHQFDDLTITDQGFSVVLSFDNVKEKVGIPFDALVAFADPSVKFGLQFRHAEEMDTEEDDFTSDAKEFTSSEEVLAEGDDSAPTKKGERKKKPSKSTNVVNLDTFRKK